MTTKEIIIKYLKENGYDGLYSEGQCACTIDDLAPCGDIPPECRAGVFIDVEDPACDGDEYDFCIGERRDDSLPTVKDAHISGPIEKAQEKLIKIAAGLMLKRLSEYASDYPKRFPRWVLRDIEEYNEYVRKTAIELRGIADMLKEYRRQK